MSLATFSHAHKKTRLVGINGIHVVPARQYHVWDERVLANILAGDFDK